MIHDLKAYRVEVRCTNSTRDTGRNNNPAEDNHQYFDCIDGCLYVTTDDPKTIFDRFGIDTVLSITEIGVGYTL